MKKTILIALVLSAAVALLVAGVAFAQGGNPPFGGRGMMDGSGTLHEYMQKAMAEALGLTEAQFEARHDAGENFYSIALAEGFSADEIPALMQDARATALDAAAKDGVISQEQAEWMKSRGFGRGGMMGGGYRDGTCPMYENGTATQGYGPGMMGGGRGAGRYQNQN